jgi:hypothetical protein
MKCYYYTHAYVTKYFYFYLIRILSLYLSGMLSLIIWFLIQEILIFVCIKKTCRLCCILLVNFSFKRCIRCNAKLNQRLKRINLCMYNLNLWSKPSEKCRWWYSRYTEDIFRPGMLHTILDLGVSLSFHFFPPWSSFFLHLYQPSPPLFSLSLSP